MNLEMELKPTIENCIQSFNVHFWIHFHWISKDLATIIEDLAIISMYGWWENNGK